MHGPDRSEKYYPLTEYTTIAILMFRSTSERAGGPSQPGYRKKYILSQKVRIRMENFELKT